MPLLADRFNRESELAAALLAAFARLRADLLAGKPDFFGFASDVTAALRNSLAATFAAAGGWLAVEMAGTPTGGDGRITEAMLRTRGEAYAAGVAAALAMKIANDVRFGSATMLPIGATDAQRQSSTAQLFTPARAQSIAITETTRAISAGEDDVAALIAVATQLAVTWFWEIEDERACDLCKELDGSERPGVQPPRHPGCRCRKRYAMKALSGRI